MLRQLVAAGQLPPVEQRLPEEPAMVEPLHEVGEYGGTWRRLAIYPDDTLADMMTYRLGYEPLVRWDRNGIHPVPGVAKAWQVEEGGKRYVLQLRKGIKWSDGYPFTSEDILFWFEDLQGQLGLSLEPLAPKDTKLSVSAPSPYVVIFEFDKPNGIFPEKLCYQGHLIYQPKHYLKQFHVKYANPQKLEKMMVEGGYHHWTQLYLDKCDLNSNSECPTIRPWRIKVGPPAMTYIAERNPYYWKVDTAGNQLPYIDRISFRVVDSSEVLNLIACTGGVDMQSRHLDPGKYTLFMSPENRKRGGIVRYRVLADPGPGNCVGVMLNLSTQNERLRPYISDRRFRIALSVAVNRKEVIELITGGLGDPSNGVGFPADPYFVAGMDQHNIQYDPNLANRLLDEVGLRRGPDGMRRYPDGKPFREILYCVTAGTAGELELEQLVAEQWHDAGLKFIIKSEPTQMSRMRASNGDSDFICAGQAGLHWILQPSLYVPLEDLAYFAPQYGRYVQTEGKSGFPPTAEFRRLIDWYYELVHTLDPQRKLELGRNILWQWSHDCYMIGIFRQYAMVIASNQFRNLPDHMLTGDWRIQFPGYLQPEQFYLESKQHTIRAEAAPHGIIFPSGEFRVYHGMEQEFAVTADEGYVVADVNVNGQSIGATTSCRIDRVTADGLVKVTFRLRTK
jgi:peptide/nickel transport system substrate-binding protein